MIGRTNCGVSAEKYPVIDPNNTSCTYSFDTSEGDGNWKLKILKGGTICFSKINTRVDIFVVGGGSGGGSTSNNQYTKYGGTGGNGGYTGLVLGNQLVAGTVYNVSVGAGGSAGTTSGAGGTSSFGSLVSASGGESVGWASDTYSSGGSGGGGSSSSQAGRAGGSDGGNGTAGSRGPGGHGMGTYSATGIYYVREFREAGGALYSGGGGSGASENATAGAGGAGGGGTGGRNASGYYTGTAGLDNTGGGGGGGYGKTSTSYAGGKGGSGIVILRNARS